MNIQNIFGFTNSVCAKNNDAQKTTYFPKYGLVMAKPIQTDTVSFKATPKTMASRTDAITMKLAKQINADAEYALNYMQTKLNRYLYDLVASSYAPTNPIEVIKSRTKSATSIIEKAATREWTTKEEIKNKMTDLAGMKIIMRDGSREQVNRVIDRLMSFVEEGGRILEIENKRPDPIYDANDQLLKSYDYASPRKLIQLRQLASKALGKQVKLTDETTPSNYMAIHVLMELPNGITGELQIMGHDIAALKELEDMCYKVKGNKNLNKKYAPIEKTLAPLKPPVAKNGVEDEEYLQKLKAHNLLKEEYEKYTQEAYLEQREKEPRAFKSKRKDTFLKIPDYLPQELDFNNLDKLKKECDLKALKS